jgi:ComF family protein
MNISLRTAMDQLDRAARFWLGTSRPMVSEVLDASAWEPDQPCDYCPHCGSTVGPGERTIKGCTSCRNRSERRIGDGIVRLGSYAGDLSEWIKATKYLPWHEMGDALGRKLGYQVRRSGLVDVKLAIVVPMPMPWQRRVFRGIDHSRVIAQAAAREMSSVVVPMLSRANGPTQASLEPGQRRANADRGLRLRRRFGGWPIDGMEIVLVDDVTTTGSSLRAAIRLLKGLKSAKVVAAVVAVSDETARRARSTVESTGGQSVRTEPVGERIEKESE